MIDVDEHVGKRYVGVDIAAPSSPAFRAIIPAEADPAALVLALQADILAAVERHFGTIIDWGLQPVRVELRGNGEVILPLEERRAKSEAERKAREPSAAEKARRIADLTRKWDEHPDNGKRGWWRCEDYRHAVLVSDCSTAREASEKAMASGELVFAPGPDEVWFLSAELPDVVGLG